MNDDNNKSELDKVDSSEIDKSDGENLSQF